jgi:hypothetical protein
MAIIRWRTHDGLPGGGRFRAMQPKLGADKLGSSCVRPRTGPDEAGGGAGAGRMLQPMNPSSNLRKGATMTLGYGQPISRSSWSFQRKFFGVGGRAERGGDDADLRRQARDLRGCQTCTGRTRGGGDRRGAGRRAVRGRHRPRREDRGVPAGDAGREERAGGVRLPVRRGLRRAHRVVRPELLQGAGPLQHRGRPGDERAPGRPAEQARRLAARARAVVPVRAARPGDLRADRGCGGRRAAWDSEERPSS